MRALMCCHKVVQSKAFVILCSWAVFVLVYVLCFSALNNFRFTKTGNVNDLGAFRSLSLNATENQIISSLLSWKKIILSESDGGEGGFDARSRSNKNVSDGDVVKFDSGSKNKSDDLMPQTPASQNDQTPKEKYDNISSSISSVNRNAPPTNFRELFKVGYDKFNVDLGTDEVGKGDNSTKYLIYRCDSKWMSHCGGWADRIKGVMAGYVIANLTGRTFKAEIRSHGCDLLDYIVPNRVDWSLPRSFHTQVLRSEEVSILNVVDSSGFYNGVSTTNFRSLPGMQSKYVYFKANLDFTDGFKSNKIHADKLSWMANLTRDQVAGNIFRRLFKLSPPVQKRLDEFLSKSLRDSSEKLVCAHIRMGRNPSIPRDSAIRNNPDVLPEVWEFVEKAASEYNSTKVFVMSDSEDTIRDAKKQRFIRERLILIPGEISHIEKTHGEKDEDICESQTKVVLEQFVLMHCDVLMVSMSGLSRMAAYVRGSDEGLFCLVSGEVIPCQLARLKEIYKIRG